MGNQAGNAVIPEGWEPVPVMGLAALLGQSPTAPPPQNTQESLVKRVRYWPGSSAAWEGPSW
jgi:hypothetical protein